jgi:serine-threonine kinase receptor-associated protein
VTADPNILVSASNAEKDVLVWDTRTQSIAKKLSFDDNVVSLSMSSDSSHFVCTTAAKTVEFFTVDKFAQTQKHKMDRVCSCAAYHVKKGLFVTGSDVEEWVRGYDFSTGKELFVNKGHHGVVRCIAFNPEKDFFATGADDATIRFWELKDLNGSAGSS